MSNAFFKETSFKLNQPIYQKGNWNKCCWEIRCLSIKIQHVVSTKMCAHLYARVWTQKSIKIGLRAKFRVFAYVWVCMSCKLEHAWCHRRCFPRLFPFGLLSMWKPDPENSLESSLDLSFKAPSCTAGSPALGCLGQDGIHRKVFHEHTTQESRLFPANSDTAPWEQ